MPRITPDQRAAILRLLDDNISSRDIAAQLGLSVPQVAAVAAHRTLGNYRQRGGSRSGEELRGGSASNGIVLGTSDIRPVYWDPTRALNPHLLIIGGSGSGKTYSASCLIAELRRAGIASIVFDYGQGFTDKSRSNVFERMVSPREIDAAQLGISISPFQLFATDVHGPLNVAQRIADTLHRVYSGIGIQQHALIRDAVLDVLTDSGVRKHDPATWNAELPPFRLLHQRLVEYSLDYSSEDRKTSRTAASHISSLFVFDIFRKKGARLDWATLTTCGEVTIIQLRGLEPNVQKVVTEFLLWNLLGFVESTGLSNLRCFIVLDEAHRLTSGSGTALDKLLREGRKYGIAALLASQQPEDFTPVAFANTATKLIFQMHDTHGALAKQLAKKLQRFIPAQDLFTRLMNLRRGEALAISDDHADFVRFSSFEERFNP